MNKASTNRRRPLLFCVLALPFLAAVYALILGYWARRRIRRGAPT